MWSSRQHPHEKGRTTDCGGWLPVEAKVSGEMLGTPSRCWRLFENFEFVMFLSPCGEIPRGSEEEEASTFESISNAML